jgi:glucose/arabinose dehydrogenase
MNPSFRRAWIFSALMVVLLTPSAWAQSSSFTVVASGLDGPRGLKFGPDGAFYVAEAGSGGDALR